MFRHFPYLWLYHKRKHTHNITKHNTLIFYVVHYQEGSYIHMKFFYMYSVKGKYKVPLHTTCNLSLSLSQSLCAPSSQISLFFLSKWSIHFPIRYERTKGLCKTMASSKDKDIFPFTIYSLFIVWLKSLRLHLCGPKAPHPQNLL